MNKQEPILIHQLANGFIVQPAVTSQAIGLHEQYVFNRVEELQAWIAEHFSAESS